MAKRKDLKVASNRGTVLKVRPSPHQGHHTSVQCVIFVGGPGTRLGRFAENRPKPLAPVGGKPFLEMLVRQLARHGFDEIVLLAGYLGSKIQDLFSEDFELDPYTRVRTTVLVEPEPAGTAGALKFAQEALDEVFLLVNGDRFFDINVLDLIAMPAREPWLVKIALREVPDSGRYGVAELQDEHVRAFGAAPEPGQPGVISGGVYWAKKELLDFISVTPASLERDVLPRLARRGLLRGRVYDAFFIDIGIPEDLRRADALVPSQERRGAAFLDRDGVLNVDNGYVGRISEFEWVNGAREAVKRLNDAGFLVFVVTNQAGVAHGFYEIEDVEALHRWMQVELRDAGAHIDAFRYCPYHEGGARSDYAKAHPWRKPEPGMLLDLIQHWPVREEQSFLVGDKRSDIEAAERINMPAYRFEGGNLDIATADYLRDRSPWPQG